MDNKDLFAHWIYVAGNSYECSACHRLTTITKVMGKINFEYCPYCGRYMKEDGEYY